MVCWYTARSPRLLLVTRCQCRKSHISLRLRGEVLTQRNDYQGRGDGVGRKVGDVSGKEQGEGKTATARKGSITQRKTGKKKKQQNQWTRTLEDCRAEPRSIRQIKIPILNM